MRLSEVVEALAIATRADGRSPATVRAYRRKLRPLVDFLADRPIQDVTTADLRAYIADLRDRATRWSAHPVHQERKGGLSPFTIAGYVKALKLLFNFAEREDIIAANPARRIKTPALRRDRPKAISPEDFLALLATCAGGTVIDRRDRAILLLLRDTGARVGGLCGLTLDDLDLEAGRALVKEKGNKTRFVFLSPPTVAALRDWLEARPEDQGPWLFITLANRASGRLTENGVRHLLKERAKRAGTKGPINPHAFRHAYARDYLLDGGDLASLADILGHSGVEITKRFYAIFDVGHLQEMHARHSLVAGLGGDGDED